MFETSQSWPVWPKGLRREHGVSGIWPKISAVSSATQGQQLLSDVVNPSYSSPRSFSSILIARPDPGDDAGKVPVSTAESSGIGSQVGDSSTTLKKMEIAKC